MKIAKNQKQAISQLGISLSLLKAARDGGASGFRSNGTIDIELVQAWLDDNKDVVEKFNEAPDYLLERAKHEKAKREKAELALEVAKKNLIPRSLVRQSVIKAISAAKSRTFNIPFAVGQRYALEDDPVTIEQDLTERLIEAFEELANVEWLESGDVEFKAPTPPKKKATPRKQRARK